MFVPTPSGEDSRVLANATAWTRSAGRHLSLVSAMALTGLLVGCSSQPVQRGQGVVIPVTSKAQQAQQNKQSRQQRASGRTYAAGQPQGLLDADSLDQLELLLEATDMQAVENNRLSVLRHGDLWGRMRAGFKMDLNQSNSRIAAQQSWFVTRQSYLDRLTARASRYLYHTVSEAEKRGLPTELALLPVIESSYDPAATSNAAAAGMWQFIPSTGKIYGLRQDSQYDGRRDVVESTRAAYDFLSSLYNQFGSWELALAAYNCGGGCVQRAINRNAADGLPTDFWSLRLPTETKNYVPRFLAVAQIVNNPDRHNVTFPPIANRPHFREVPIAGQVRLSDAAQLLGMTEQELYVLNPGFRQGVTTVQGPQRLLIPTSLAPQYDAQLQKLPTVDGSRPVLLASANMPAGNAVLGQSSGYSNAEAAALMGRPSAPLTVQRTNTSDGVTTQVTTRSNSNSAPEITTRVRLPTNSAALAALASAASIPTGTQSRLALPVGSGSMMAIASGVRPVGEPPLSDAERQRIAATTATGSAQPTAVNTSASAAAAVSARNQARTEKPLSEAERQDLLQTLTATSTIAPQVSLEPALNPTEKAQLVQEIQQIAPAGTTVVDPLDGKIPLVALQTQQSVLESRGTERQVSYEQPVFSQPAASRSNTGKTSASSTARPTGSATAALTLAVSKPARPKGSRTVYTVQAGDNLTALASRFKVDVAQIAEWNQMSARANLMAGTSLYLYGVTMPVEKPTSYKVQAGDTLTGVASRFGLTNQQLASYNDLTPSSNLLVGVNLALVEPTKRPASATPTPAANTTATASSSKANAPRTADSSDTESYTVQRGDTLSSIATTYEVSPQDLAKLNQFSTKYSVRRGQKIRVPVLAPKTIEYTVQRGDSLIQVATRYDISAEALAALNNTSASRMLQVGERISVPNTEPLQSRSAASKTSNTNSAKGTKDDSSAKSSAISSPRSVELTAKDTTSYQVKRGDTLIGLAAEYGVEVDELAKFNKLAATAILQAGQRLKVPEQSTKNTAAASSVTEYRTKSGDTLGKLATRYGVSLTELAAMNNMPTSRMLMQGERLTVPATDKADTPDSTEARSNTRGHTRDDSRATTRQARNGRGDNSLPTQSYTVKRGDSLIGLAGTYNIDIDSLAKMNGLTSKSMLQAGQTLKVPDTAPKMADYRVRSGDTLARIATKHGITLAQLAEINELSVNAPLQIGSTLSVPASGER